MSQSPPNVVGAGTGQSHTTGSCSTGASASGLLGSTPAAPNSQPTPTVSGDVGMGFATAGASSNLVEAGVGVGRFTETRPGDDSNVASNSNPSQGFPQAAGGSGTGRPARGVAAPPSKARPRSSNYGPFSGPRR
jgi:hypothetical protein